METQTELKVGMSAVHATLGNCIILRITPKTNSVWIQVWGGPCGDKLYTFKGQRLEDLKPRGK